jgi:hypothetical protein
MLYSCFTSSPVEKEKEAGADGSRKAGAGAALLYYMLYYMLTPAGKLVKHV